MDENRTVRCSTLVEGLNPVPDVDGNLAAIGGNAERCGIINQSVWTCTIRSEITNPSIQPGDKTSICCLHPRVAQAIPLFLRRTRVLEDTPAPSRALIVGHHPTALNGITSICGVFVFTARLIDKERPNHLLTRGWCMWDMVPRNVQQRDSTERKRVLGLNDSDVVRPPFRTFPDNAIMVPYHTRQAVAVNSETGARARAPCIPSQ